MWRYSFFFLFCAHLSAQVTIPSPYYSANRRHVATNLNTLSSRHQLTSGLSNLVSSLSTQSSVQINSALNQMHPAPYSTLVEIQAAFGGQILSLFHRHLSLGCTSEQGIWLDPIANWLKEGDLGEQIGFDAATKGVLAGYDVSLGEHVSVGIGIGWNHTHFSLHQGYGRGIVNQYIGSIYSDILTENYYFGFSFYGGIDQNNVFRDIQIPSFGTSAHGHFNSLDIAGQFASAYLFGVPYCYLYPYANFDFFFFRGKNFSETGASSLNLDVTSHSCSRTIRTEAGIGLQVQDVNFEETISVVPTFAFGWAMECPLSRAPFVAQFSGEPLSFEAKGWNHTWQLLAVDLGLKMCIYNFILSGEYITESSPNKFSDFWSQRLNIEFEYIW